MTFVQWESGNDLPFELVAEGCCLKSLGGVDPSDLQSVHQGKEFQINLSSLSIKLTKVATKESTTKVTTKVSTKVFTEVSREGLWQMYGPKGGRQETWALREVQLRASPWTSVSIRRALNEKTKKNTLKNIVLFYYLYYIIYYILNIVIQYLILIY